MNKSINIAIVFSALSLMHCSNNDQSGHSSHSFNGNDRMHINGVHSSYKPVETADVEDDFNGLIEKDHNK